MHCQAKAVVVRSCWLLGLREIREAASGCDWPQTLAWTCQENDPRSEGPHSLMAVTPLKCVAANLPERGWPFLVSTRGNSL